MITEAQAKRQYIATNKKLEKIYGKKLDDLEKERDEKIDRIYEEYSFLIEEVENEMDEKDNAAYDKYMKVVDHYIGVKQAKLDKKKGKK